MSKRSHWHDSLVVLADGEGASSIPDDHSFRVVTVPHARIPTRVQNVFVLALASRLSEVATLVTATSRQHQLRALFVRTDLDPRLLPQIFQRAGLRSMHGAIVHYGHDIPFRVLRAWQIDAQHDLIADAAVIGDSLQVISCEPRTYLIPFSSIAPLRNVPAGERANLRVASDGSHVHWPSHDIHMDLASLLPAVDVRRKEEKVKRAYGQNYGTAITVLRRKHGLKQTDIRGLSDREVRRIEADGEVTLDSLKKLAAAHGLELPAYLDTVARLAQGIGGAAAQDSDGEQDAETGT